MICSLIEREEGNTTQGGTDEEREVGQGEESDQMKCM